MTGSGSTALKFSQTDIMNAALVCALYALPVLGAPETASWVHQQTVCEDKGMGLACLSGYRLQILSATYGRDDWTTCPHSSIQTIHCSARGELDRVRGLCQGQQTCTVPVTNTFLGGDPCEHTYKYLRVSYGCVRNKAGRKVEVTSGNNAGPKVEVTCEGQSMSLTCSAGKTIRIVTAAYGRSDGTTCPHASILTTSCLASSSNSVVVAACQGKGSCSVSVANTVFGGDPCKDTYKYLKVGYKCL